MVKDVALFLIAASLLIIALVLADIAESLRIVHAATGKALIFDFSGGKHGKATRAIEK